jgi:hypothetical protein
MDVNDIVTRLRQWAIATDAVPASDLMDEAAAEIERLRSQPCPYVTGTVTRHCTLTPFTLNDAEREAIGVAIQCVEAARAQRHPEEEEARDLLWKTTCGLRSLLDRTDRT